MLKRILYLLNIVFVLLLLGVYLGAYIRPEAAPYLSLFSYVYPFALIANLLFCVLWLFLKWKYLILPLAVIIAGYDYIPRFFNVSEEASCTEQSLNIMTYNVKHFTHKSDAEWKLEQGNIDSIISLIERLNPDILCLQEYTSSKSSKNSPHKRLPQDLDYEYYFAPQETKQRVGGSVIYSKKPIIRSGCPFPMKKEFQNFCFADIKSGKETLRVYNVHLASYKMFDQEKNEIGAIAQGNLPSEETSRNVAEKLIEANKERSKETSQMVEVLKQTSHDFVLVGDFNATAYSYTYREFSKLASDAFVERGRGFSGTYNGPLPPFRIDYVFLSEGIEALSYRNGDYDFSDHQPVMVEFQFKQTK